MSPGKKGCGVVGQIISVVIAVVVAAVVMPYAAAALSNVLGAGGTAFATGAGAAASWTTAGAVAGGAVAGAAGSLASQAFNIATGAQDSINWKGVGIAAIAGGIGGAGISRLPGLDGTGFVADAVRGAASNVLTQGVSIATGLQDRFDWAGVAAAGVIRGVASRLGDTAFMKQLASQSGLAAEAATGLAAAAAAARSLITGTSFGDKPSAQRHDQHLAECGR